jgi:hypothetical protein
MRWAGVHHFLLLGILYLILLPIFMIIIGNIFFLITGEKDWDQWLKISSDYNDVFTIIAIFPFLFIMFEIAIFVGYYTKIYTILTINKFIIYIIFSLIVGIIFCLSQILVRKIFRT